MYVLLWLVTRLVARFLLRKFLRCCVFVADATRCLLRILSNRGCRRNAFAFVVYVFRLAFASSPGVARVFAPVWN